MADLRRGIDLLSEQDIKSQSDKLWNDRAGEMLQERVAKAPLDAEAMKLRRPTGGAGRAFKLRKASPAAMLMGLLTSVGGLASSGASKIVPAAKAIGRGASKVVPAAKAVGRFTKNHHKAVAVGAGSLAGAGGAGAYLMSGKKPEVPAPEPSILDKGINKTKELATTAVNKGKELTDATVNKGKELATGAGAWAKENWKPLAGGAAVGIGSILLYELLRKEKEKEPLV